MQRRNLRLYFAPVFYIVNMLVVLVLVFSITELAFGQTGNDKFRSLENWECVKRKLFLRDEKGDPSWLTSKMLLASVIERVPLRPPLLLGKNDLYGKVTVQLLVGKDGKVRCVRGVEGSPMAISSAVNAVSKWVFKPHEVKGKPVSVLGWVTVSYDFRQ